jgi:hypothetical protein
VFTVETQNSTADPVLYVFLQNNPQQFSVVNDDYNSTISYESKVSFTTPVAGFYAVLVRSYWAGQNGVGNILYNGSVHFSNGAISGTLVQFPTSTKTGTLNCFTALPGGETDTRLFTMSGPLSPVNGYNDDWQGSSECDFDWGHLSRIRQNYTSSIKACLITHYDAGQSGTCDVYTACSDGITMGFPNFKIRDAIMSAPATPDRRYNCIAWSGGLTSNWVNPYYTLSDFDLYYSNSYPGLNPRYAGAENFTRTNATPANSVVDLWATGTQAPYPGTFQHGSVKKPANSQLHGYDWESKCGPNIRVFHPENALSGLSGPGYGFVVYKYKSAGTFAQTQKMAALGINRPIATLDESVNLGLTKVNEVSYTIDEKTKLAKHIGKIPAIVSSEFTAKFENWRKTWEMEPTKYKSHTRDFAKSDEYKVLIDFCIQQGKQVWPLLFTSFNNGNLPLVNVFEDLIYPDRKSLMDEVKMKNESNRYTADGTYVVYTLDGEWREFCKKVLQREFE